MQALIEKSTPTVHAASIGEAIDKWDISELKITKFMNFSRLHLEACEPHKPSARPADTEALDTDRENGVIRSAENAFSKEGGLAVLFGNIAEEGCVVKTAGVDESIWNFQDQPEFKAKKKR